MNKLNGKSLDIVSQNIEKLRELFPEVFSEGKIDFAKLQEELGAFVEDEAERYNFTWAGKSEAKRIAQTPSTGTLRPCKEESKNWDTTQNLYIEGDNLEVLKLLQKSYHKQVKMIYIDPPYNTGKDFVYKDNFKDNIKNYLQITGQVDSEGNRLSTNSDTNGRYHSDWLNMMYPRLKLARNLLKDDGVIFISIDDNEISNLRKVCDEIFGEDNFLTEIIRSTGTPTGGGGATPFVNEIDFLLVYSKTKNLIIQGTPLTKEESSIYDREDELGRYLMRPLRRTGGEDRREDRPTMYYPLNAPDGTLIYPIAPAGYESRWICGQDKFNELNKNNLIEWKKINDEKWVVYQKFYLEGRLKQPGNLWTKVEGNKKATRDIRELFDSKKVFDFPKPVGFLSKILQISTNSNDVILDFFAGSCSTAHSVMKLNCEDSGNRKFIMVQLPEETDETTEAYKAGYKNICEIGKERIRRAGEKIKTDNAGKDLSNLDIGFKVLKLDSSNIKTWDSNFDNLEQNLLDAIENIKEDRSSHDLLYEILLKYGLDLTLPIEEKIIHAKKVFIIGYGALIVCLDNEITLEVVEAIAKLKNEYKSEITRVVFKDSSFADAVVKTNALQVLKQFEIDEVVSV
ncbi:MAG: site-specific DNA-methyltransferase [Helicobacteraceae bacterium CG2_30_36_10]|nr:MAG: site-specific DNA-methyltransferase [Helicobacteraceae bacterium CG2_30_36_10]